VDFVRRLVGALGDDVGGAKAIEELARDSLEWGRVLQLCESEPGPRTVNDRIDEGIARRRNVPLRAPTLANTLDRVLRAAREGRWATNEIRQWRGRLIGHLQQVLDSKPRGIVPIKKAEAARLLGYRSQEAFGKMRRKALDGAGLVPDWAKSDPEQFKALLRGSPGTDDLDRGNVEQLAQWQRREAQRAARRGTAG
jgi:hypothetical protein